MDRYDYKAIIVRQAEEDIKNTLAYISEELSNPTAAKNLWLEIAETVERIEMFPYAMPKIKNEKITLGSEYRRANVKNFVLIYKIVEEVKEVRLMAAFYAPSDIMARLFERL